jgi:hypothetical protein
MFQNGENNVADLINVMCGERSRNIGSIAQAVFVLKCDQSELAYQSTDVA